MLIFASHGKELRFYSKCDVKPLEDLKQEREMIWLIFFRDKNLRHSYPALHPKAIMCFKELVSNYDRIKELQWHSSKSRNDPTGGRRVWESKTDVVCIWRWTTWRFLGPAHHSRMQTLETSTDKSKPAASSRMGKVLKTGPKGMWLTQKPRMYGYWKETKPVKEASGWGTWRAKNCNSGTDGEHHDQRFLFSW